MRLTSLACAASVLMLAACSQSDAPSEELGLAAEELVDSVLDTPVATEEAPLGPLAPRDECTTLGGAEDFLAMFKGAVATRDTAVLVALTAEDVKLGFGGNDGADVLRADLEAEGSTLWYELEKITLLGCAANDFGGLTMPWYFAQDFKGDAFETYIVTTDDGPLHAEPRESSARLAILNWQEVRLRFGEDGTLLVGGNPEVREESWIGVSVPGERGEEPMNGFIRATQLRSLVDYRMLASSRNGRWRITAILAGD